MHNEWIGVAQLPRTFQCHIVNIGSACGNTEVLAQLPRGQIKVDVRIGERQHAPDLGFSNCSKNCCFKWFGLMWS